MSDEEIQKLRDDAQRHNLRAMIGEILVESKEAEINRLKQEVAWLKQDVGFEKHMLRLCEIEEERLKKEVADLKAKVAALEAERLIRRQFQAPVYINYPPPTPPVFPGYKSQPSWTECTITNAVNKP